MYIYAAKGKPYFLGMHTGIYGKIIINRKKNIKQRTGGQLLLACLEKDVIEEVTGIWQCSLDGDFKIILIFKLHKPVLCTLL